MMAEEPLARGPERYPFWSYTDLLVFIGLTIPCLLLGLGIVKGVFWALRLHPAVKTWEMLFSQFAGYGLLFMVLWAILKLQYGRPFWESLAWAPLRFPAAVVVLAGVATVFAIGGLGYAIHTPTSNNAITDLLKDRTSLVLVAIFGVTLGPLCEELMFRGFLQPLLVKSWGVTAGILGAAIPFGVLHFSEYGNSWKHVLLISLAGAAFGWMRQASGSTKAATLMHGVFNGVQFVAFVAGTKS